MRRLVLPILLGTALLATVLAVRSGDPDRHTVRAEFQDVMGIRKGFWVRVDGARVGDVTDVDVTRHDTAIVTMELDEGTPRPGRGARMDVRPANLLGEKYIQLTPGDKRRPLPESALIPLARTGVAVELDDILNTLDAGVRTRLRILINEIGVALAGHGKEFEQLLTGLPPTVEGARSVVAQLAAENRALGRLVDRASVAVGPVHGKRRDVGRLVDSTRDVLAITAQRRRQLAATVRSAPGALRSITAALDKLNTAATELEPAAPLLREAAPQLASTLRALPEFADSLDKPLATAREVAPALGRLGSQGNRAVARLRPTVRELAGFSTDVAPLVRTLGRSGGVDGVLGILNNWATASSYKDGISHYFDFHASFSKETIGSVVDRFALGPEGKEKARPAPAPKLPLDPRRLLPDGPKSRPQVPKLTRLPQLSTPPAVSDVTGPVADEVNQLLDFLLAP